MRVTCLNCEFWNMPTRWDESWAIQAAECRRRAPVLIPVLEYDAPGPTAKWPQTNPNEWCAEAQPVSHETIEQRRAALRKLKQSPSWKFFEKPTPQKKPTKKRRQTTTDDSEQ